ncbi:hypothetical protein B0T14DRAFT_497486 [Immersiella caudata]|uniref:Uncharacterized protein n=1 Tax=Immersiella caudata TaxID=314043 RepID=A0AA39WIU4_9PEZI|nr:hypothetical protein B0T14DRAFT_497486 [Immersiella caudata]
MKTPASSRFDESQRSNNAIACPFSPACPKSYANVKDIGQHLEKTHSTRFNCMLCGGSLGFKQYGYEKAKLLQSKHVCPPDPKSQHLITLDEERLQLLKNIGKGVNGEERLCKAYEICGVPIPDCYHVRPLDGGGKPTEGSVVLGQTQESCPGPISARPGRRGFVPPEIQGPDIPPRTQPLTAEAVSQSWHTLNQGHSPFVIGGGDAMMGSDSGYASVPPPKAFTAATSSWNEHPPGYEGGTTSDDLLNGTGSGREVDDFFRELDCSD